MHIPFFSSFSVSFLVYVFHMVNFMGSSVLVSTVLCPWYGHPCCGFSTWSRGYCTGGVTWELVQLPCTNWEIVFVAPSAWSIEHTVKLCSVCLQAPLYLLRQWVKHPHSSILHLWLFWMLFTCVLWQFSCTAIISFTAASVGLHNSISVPLANSSTSIAMLFSWLLQPSKVIRLSDFILPNLCRWIS